MIGYFLFHCSISYLLCVFGEIRKLLGHIMSMYLDQPMLMLSPDTTQGSRAALPSDTWMLFGAVVIFRSAGRPGNRSNTHLFSFTLFTISYYSGCCRNMCMCFAAACWQLCEATPPVAQKLSTSFSASHNKHKVVTCMSVTG